MRRILLAIAALNALALLALTPWLREDSAYGMPRWQVAYYVAGMAPGLARSDGAVLAGRVVAEDEHELTLDVGGSPHPVAQADIAHRTPATTGMPPMGRTLSPRALRDLIAYLATL